MHSAAERAKLRRQQEEEEREKERERARKKAAEIEAKLKAAEEEKTKVLQEKIIAEAQVRLTFCPTFLRFNAFVRLSPSLRTLCARLHRTVFLKFKLQLKPLRHLQLPQRCYLEKPLHPGVHYVPETNAVPPY